MSGYLEPASSTTGRPARAPGPLSAQQEPIWLFEQITPGTAVYHIPWIVRLRGSVDPAAVARALRRLIGRHAVLRAAFTSVCGVPRQVVMDINDVPLRTVDARSVDEASMNALLEPVIHEPFDLARPPLLRAALLRTGDAAWTLAVVFHHLVCDEWSLRLFEDEFADALAAVPGPQGLPTDYTAYAAEQRGPHGAARRRAHSRYWQARLAGAVASLAPQADRPGGGLSATAGATAVFDIPADTAEHVRALARRTASTGFMITAAALCALLYRHTGAEDLVIGTPSAGRGRPEWERVFGNFVSLMPLRTRVGPGLPFSALADRVRVATLDDLVHDEIPPEVITGGCGMPQVVFGWHREAAKPLRLGAATAVPAIGRTGTAKFDLIWSVYDDGRRLRGEIEYRTEKYDAATIGLLAERWCLLLADAVHFPDTPVARLAMLTATDRAVVISRPTVPASVTPADSVPTRFAEIARRYAGRPAVRDGGRTLTYRGLSEDAGRLASWLRARGVEPGDRVAIRVGRNHGMIVADLAVLQAGAVYVPLNQADPADRVAAALQGAGARMILADELVGIPPGPWHAVRFDEALDQARRLDGDSPAMAARADAPAYVIHTSGSTGRPKGVVVSHRNLLTLLDATAGIFRPGPDDVWTQFHNHAFDFSVWEAWGPLLSGGMVRIVPDDAVRDPNRFARLAASERVTVLSLTPSALTQVTAALRAVPRDLPQLRWVVLGGEALQPHQVRAWFAVHGAACLCNMYGITETTVHATWHVIKSPDDMPSSVVGRPLPHLTATIRDIDGGLAPIGAAGELWIGGSGVSYGYQGRPAETAERFVPDAFGRPGERAYRSGDLARWRLDGNLEYLGRRDGQVKVRGFRVEPGEVRAALARHEAIVDCAVTGYHGPGGERLAAYVVAASPRPPASALRRHVAGLLPPHMVPTVIIFVDALPTTANGKTDLRALPDPEDTAEEHDTIRHPPRGPEQEALAGAWSTVLEVANLDADDNFFELGGDSIRAVQLAGRLEMLGWRLRAFDVFDAPVLAAMAERLTPMVPRAMEPDRVDVPFALLEPDDRAFAGPELADAYPMTDMQQAMVFHQELDPDRRPYHNVNSYRILSALDEAAFATAVTELTERHPVLRTGFAMVGFSEPMQVVYRRVTPRLVFEDLQDLSDAARQERIEATMRAEFDAMFDVADPPLLRMVVQRLSPGAFQLTLTEHHGILDGWSFTSLLADVLERHRDRQAGIARPMPAPTSSFRRFVELERRATQSESAAAFWKARLNGFDGRLFGSKDRFGGRRPYETLEHLISPDVFRSARRYAGSLGVGVKSCALAAHLAALAEAANQDTVTTGVVTNGRPEEAGGAAEYGLFLNILPLRATVGRDTPGLAALLRHVHAEETAMLPYRLIPFARLARFMAHPRLDVDFTYNRFHALGSLQHGEVRLDDARIGCEPTLRLEPNHVPFGVALMQDPGSDRAILAIDHTPAVVPTGFVPAYAAAFERSLETMADAWTSTVAGARP